MKQDKCPTCGCAETTKESFREDFYYVEIKETCKNCGRTKYYWAYGTTYVEMGKGKNMKGNSMKIIKMGNEPISVNTYELKCEYCGCIFF